MKNSSPQPEILASTFQNKRILVAPLNWGLGHATRCIPIINALILNKYTPVIASDGAALQLLRKEFPELKSYELPSYGITYTKNGKNLNYKLLLELPKILKNVTNEKKEVLRIITALELKKLASENSSGKYIKV